ncbi:MAG: peroxiredoxin, partial [Alphaproteobacteria bacterium]
MVRLFLCLRDRGVMAIQVGDKVPEGSFKLRTDAGGGEVSTGDLFDGRRVVVVAVPGAFTPTCSTKHLPGYVNNVEAFQAKGIDCLACLSVNDAFVMEAWAKDQSTDGKVSMLADIDGAYTKALGMEMDLSAAGLGMRSKRYAMVVDNGTVTHLAVEERPGVLDVSSAESVLASL